MMSIKIATYNIHNGRETDTLTKNIQNLAKQGVSLFCLQEFWKWMQPTDLEPVLLNNLGSDWSIELKTPNYPKHDWGTCLLWNRKVLDVVSLEHIALPLLARTSWYERWWIRRGGYDSEAFYPQRSALIGTFRWGATYLRVINIHLDWQGGIEQRKKQLGFVKNFLLENPVADYEIVCGDFNTIGLSKKKQTETIETVFGDDFENTCTKPKVTCPPFFNPDQIFVRNMKILGHKVHRLSGSDHFPISVELSSGNGENGGTQILN